MKNVDEIAGVNFKEINKLQKELILSGWVVGFRGIGEKSLDEAKKYCERYIKLRETFERIENEQ